VKAKAPSGRTRRTTDSVGDIEAERERFFTLSLDMLCISNSDGYFKRLNPAFSTTLGWSIDELLTRPFIDFVHPDDGAATLREVERQVAAGEKVLKFENRYLHKDGSWRVLSWRSVPQPGGFMYATARDVTEERKLQAELTQARDEADRANRAKSVFLATMSHEIRTPLYGVLGMVDLLGMTNLDEEQRSSIDVVRKSGETLQRIIDDVLEFSKIEAGQLDMQQETVSIAALVAEVRNAYAGTASGKNLVIDHRVDPRISPAVTVDGVRLQQVLNNFASNAIKFTPRGRVSITADLVGRADGIDTIRFAVKDTGIGIAPEDQARLFQPFAQAERDTTRRFGGTGLGLTICQRIASLMGGTIEMQSERGVGTTLLLVLPLPIADPAGLPARSGDVSGQMHQVMYRHAPGVKEAEAQKKLVLIVDDHPVNQKVLRMQLDSLGYAAEVAGSGAEGLQQWESGRYALVLADCHMPVMDGYEFARRVRELEAKSGAKRTPIIACTANAARGEAEICVAAGMDDYMCKPIQVAALEAKLAQWLPLSTLSPSAQRK